MAVMDEYKEEREAIKNAPIGKKIEYFLDYYKVHTCVVLIVLFVVISLVNTFLTKTETVLSCAIANATEDSVLVEELTADVIEALGIDEKEESISFDSSYYLDYETQDYNHTVSIQKIVTVISAKTIDIITANDQTFGYMAYGGYLMNLESILTEEELLEYEGQFFYVDGAIIDEIDAMESTAEEYPEYVFGDPEDMEDPIIMGIYAEADSALAQAFGYSESGVIGIVTNTLQSENAMTFLKLALEEN